jgi:hypothetical protein
LVGDGGGPRARSGLAADSLLGWWWWWGDWVGEAYVARFNSFALVTVILYCTNHFYMLQQLLFNVMVFILYKANSPYFITVISC